MNEVEVLNALPAFFRKNKALFKPVFDMIEQDLSYYIEHIRTVGLVCNGKMDILVIAQTDYVELWTCLESEVAQFWKLKL